MLDMAGSNSSLIKTIGINENQNTFPNLFDESRHIHVFLDVPYLIKLVRNLFLGQGFCNIQNEQVINSHPVQKLILLDNGNL